jgi:hypothetical protein
MQVNEGRFKATGIYADAWGPTFGEPRRGWMYFGFRVEFCIQIRMLGAPVLSVHGYTCVGPTNLFLHFTQ